MKSIFLLFLIAICGVSNAGDLHFGASVDHILVDTYEKNNQQIKYNEDNNLVIYCFDSGDCIGGMKNSYYQPSAIYLKKYEFVKNCTGLFGMNLQCVPAAGLGVASGYQDLEFSSILPEWVGKGTFIKELIDETGVVPVWVASFSLKHKNAFVSFNIFNGVARVVTTGLRF